MPRTLLDEQFADNSNSWIVGTSDAGSTRLDILAGTYTIRRTQPGGDLLTQTLGLNYDADFSIEAELRGRGSLVWGYTKGTYQAVELSTAGQWLAKRMMSSTATTLQQATLAAPADWHSLRVARVGNELRVQLDGQLVHQQAWEAPAGKKVGFVARGPESELVVRRLRVHHLAAPIRLAPNLPAGLQRERLAPPSAAPCWPMPADGKRLFVHCVINKVSPLNASISDKDVYMAERRPAGGWGPAQSLGSPINNAASNSPACPSTWARP